MATIRRASAYMFHARAIDIERSGLVAKAMAKVSFSCDASFCPHCGTLLPLPGISDVVTCLLCSYKINASGEIRRQYSFGYSIFSSKQTVNRTR